MQVFGLLFETGNSEHLYAQSAGAFGKLVTGNDVTCNNNKGTEE